MTQPNRISSLALHLAAALVAVGLAGCGATSANGDGGGADVPGSGGNTTPGSGGSGSPGTGGRSGGTGGVTGGTGGVTTGTGGAAGVAGGSGGAAGGGPGAGGRAGGTGGRGAVGGTGGRGPACVAGAMCAAGFSCQIPCRTGGQVGAISCFCSPNDVLACETCTAIPIPACAATVVNGQPCTIGTDIPCDTTCVNGVSALCACVPAGGGAAAWRCLQNPMVCM